MPQFKTEIKFDRALVISGLKQLGLGYFQKAVIADRLAVLVNYVYDHYNMQKGPVLVLATVFFAIQIYCDFAGYSNIAIGAGKILGFNLMTNFNRPYFAKSIPDFWRRWHISLTTWLRDYIFLPVTYAAIRRIKCNSILTFKKDEMGYFIGTIVTMFIAGFWHGASWTFVAWGLILGFYLCFSIGTRKIRKKIFKKTGIKQSSLLYKLITIVFIFILVCFSWIFFKSASIQQALSIIYLLPTGWNSLLNIPFFVNTILAKNNIGLNSINLLLSFILAGSFLIYEVITRKKTLSALIGNYPIGLKVILYSVFIFIIISLGVFTNKQFIYFQF